MTKLIVVALLVAPSIPSSRLTGMTGTALNAAGGTQLATPARTCVLGRVMVEGDGPMPGLTFTLTGGSGNATASVFPQDGGDFGVLLPEGERRIALNTRSLPTGYTLKTFTYGATDLLRDPLTLSRSDSSELHLTFSTAPGSWADVSGRVTGVDLLARRYSVVMSDLRQPGAPVGRDGSFAFTKVLRGNHTLQLSSAGGIPVSKSIVVADQDLASVEIAAPPQKEVVGRVVMEGGQPGKYYSFSVSLRNSHGQQTISSGAPEGTFRVALPEGESQASLSGFPAGAVKSFTYGDVNLLAEPLRVLRSDTAELRITLAPGTGAGGVPGGVYYEGPSSCVPRATGAR